MTITEIDTAALMELAKDVLRAHAKVATTGMQEAIQGALVEVGLLPESLASGEAGTVFTVLGSLCGALFDAGADTATVQAIMMGDVSRLAALLVSPARRDQLASFLVFTGDHLQKICRPGSQAPVVAVLVAVFCKTMDLVRRPS